MLVLSVPIRVSSKGRTRDFESLNRGSIPRARTFLWAIVSMADYTYDAKLVRAVDGDTVYLDVDLGFNVRVVMDFRLLGINTPETVGPTKTAGIAAKAELERLLGLGALTIQTTKADKYGRWLARIWVQHGEESVCVNDSLVQGGFATAYFGKGPKT